MKLNCPTCRTEFHPLLEEIKNYPSSNREQNDNGSLVIIHETDHFLKSTCNSCKQVIIFYQKSCKTTPLYGGGEIIEEKIIERRVIHPVDENPFNSEIKEIDSEIPEIYSCDYRESILVSKVSPKASAALSRRLLQKLLHEEFKIKKGNLSQEIDEFISNAQAPSYLTDAIDAVRQIGNFAAHPIKYEHLGEIVEVEQGEAEWLLEVLEALFDFVFIQPTKLKQRRQALNEKLKKLGKPELKGS